MIYPISVTDHLLYLWITFEILNLMSGLVFVSFMVAKLDLSLDYLFLFYFVVTRDPFNYFNIESKKLM